MANPDITAAFLQLSAKQHLALESAIARLDKFHLLILDDLAYVTKDQAETSVLFDLISARYERRSMLITANQPFGAWEKPICLAQRIGNAFDAASLLRQSL